MENCNVLLAAESLAPGNGGICRVARLMGRVLREEVAEGHLDVKAITFSGGPSALDLAIPSTTARCSRLGYVTRIAVATAISRPHVIYDSLSMARAHPRLPGLRRPYLAFMHGIEVWEGARACHLAVAKRANLLLTNTNFTRNKADSLHSGLAHAKVCWLATESDEAPVRRQSWSPEGPPSVTIIGRIDVSRYKGHAALVECWPTVKAAVPDARLQIVGKGPGLEAMKHLARSSSASESIDFLGFVPDEEIDRIWTKTHVFAMPSYGEGFGLVYIEAMRQSIPVVASVHDAAPEVNIDGQTGYNVNLGNQGELSERIIHLFRNSDHAAKLGTSGLARWHEHFRFSSFRKRFVPLLNELLAT